MPIPVTAPGETARCTVCSEPVLWVLTKGGKRWRIEPYHHEDGVIVLVDLPDGTRRARVLPGGQLPAQEPAHREHKCSRRRPGPPCRKCTGPMDAALCEAEPWARYHPHCEPPDLRELVEHEKETP